jgi:hypothetical protein
MYVVTFCKAEISSTDIMQIISLFGAFAVLRKATISFVMSVCLSVRMEQLGSHCTDETWCLGLFRKSVELFQV